MKKILLAIAMLTIISFAMSGMSLRDSDDAKQRIEIETNIHLGDTGLLRSPYYYELDAYLFLRTGEVEVNLFNVGESEVYIVDSTGRTIDYTFINTDVPATLYLSTNGPGNYCLVIVSDTCYTEGYFTL
mgnify:CR=1 FL=1